MRIAIGGAGIGGMTLAALLHRDGHDVTLHERARAFGEVGAGIQISPNGARVLHHLDLADGLRAIGATPTRVVVRRWANDRELMVSLLGPSAAARYAYPYYNVYAPTHRPARGGGVRRAATFGVGVVSSSSTRHGATLELDDGSTVHVDIVVGADGIHSAVRSSMLGPMAPRFAGLVAYRALVPRSAVEHLPVEVTNRVGPEQHPLSYFVGRDRAHYNLVCVVPERDWHDDSWTAPGVLADLRAHFATWSDDLRDVLDSVVEPVSKWALYDREPSPRGAAATSC